jgi:hypothetical protein
LSGQSLAIAADIRQRSGVSIRSGTERVRAPCGAGSRSSPSLVVRTRWGVSDFRSSGGGPRDHLVGRAGADAGDQDADPAVQGVGRSCWNLVNQTSSERHQACPLHPTDEEGIAAGIGGHPRPDQRRAAAATSVHWYIWWSRFRSIRLTARTVNSAVCSSHSASTSTSGAAGWAVFQ